MSQARTQAERIAAAFEDDELVPLGDRKAQKMGRSRSAVYVPYPQPHARNAGLEQGDDVDVYLHGPSGGVIVVPA